MTSYAPPISLFRDLDRWHDLLSHRYVCEACLTRYFRMYRHCKACGASGTIQLLTIALFTLADNDHELRNIIARGQQILLTAVPPSPPPPPDFSEGPP